MRSSLSYRRSLLLDPPSGPPSPKAKKKNPWERFYLREATSQSRVTEWDPWPVKNFRPDALFRATEDLIRQRNEASVDNFLNKIILLPASNSIAAMHGGTSNTDLYSIRSPSKLPMRIHLWRTPAGKIMVRKGIQTMTLAQLINTFEIAITTEPFQFYDFWKSVKMSEKFLNGLEVPDHLKDAFRERWWSINGFPFLDLPAELREMVLKFAMGYHAEPYARVYTHIGGCRSYTDKCYPVPAPAPCANLLLVNRQLRREALPILLSQVTFVFRKHGQLMRFFERIPKASLYALKSLELHFDHETLLEFFGAQVFQNSPKAGYSSSDYYLKESLFTNRLQLRHICIYFPHPREHRNSKRLRGACQRNVCSMIWAAARRCLRDIPQVEFRGCIKDSQKKEWLEILSLERQGILPDPQELREWERDVWSAK